MSTIIVGGANGQVGFEVAAILAKERYGSPVAVGRSPYGLATLRLLDVPTRAGDLGDADQAGALVGDADVFADFAWPRGLDAALSPALLARLGNGMRAMPRQAAFVFISTQSVYHLWPTQPAFRTYALTKLRAERFVLRLGRSLGKRTYVLRLGDVHGPFQASSRAQIDSFRATPAFVPKLKSGTVWSYDIARALVRIGEGDVSPGIYTLLAAPEWSYAELHEYYARWTHTASPVIEQDTQRRSWLRTRRAMLAGQAAGAIAGLVRREREVVEWGLHRTLPSLSRHLRFRYYLREARRDVARLAEATRWRPYSQEREVPGRRFPVEDCRHDIQERNRALLRWTQERLATVIARSAAPCAPSPLVRTESFGGNSQP
jgi:nucleoside-diphosphate-sugar epimerase